MAQPSLIREPVPDKDPLSAWQSRNGVCEMELKDGHWGGRQEKTSLMFAGVPEDPRETLTARLDAALEEAKHPKVEAPGPVEKRGKTA